MARPARPRDVDDLPEPARGPEPDPQGGPADRGRAPPARPGPAGQRQGQGDQGPGDRAHRPARGALPRLPVRALGRHVPADRHRPRLVLPPAAPDRRRAHHRPRRDHAEGGHGPGRRPHPRARHVDHPHHPRSGPGRHLLRPGGGDGAGQGGRDRLVRGDLQGPCPRLHQEADAGDAARRHRPARPAARRCRARRRVARTAPGKRPADGGREPGQGVPAPGRRRAGQGAAQRQGRRRRRRSGPWTGSASPSAAARRWAWWASPAAASPRPRP